MEPRSIAISSPLGAAAGQTDLNSLLQPISFSRLASWFRKLLPSPSTQSVFKPGNNGHSSVHLADGLNGAAASKQNGHVLNHARVRSERFSIQLTTLDELGCRYGEAEIDLPHQKMRFGLLVYLAMERSACRAKLQTLLWPEIDEERARRRLNQTIYELRQTFGASCLETRNDVVRVSDQIVIDARDFGSLAEVGEYERAIQLYNRPFLDGFYIANAFEWERWVDRKRSILARTNAHVLRNWIDRQIQGQQFEAAITQATRWLELEETEEAHKLLITALARSGRGADALADYDTWERRLREEENAIPAEDLRKLIDEIRTGKSGKRPVAN